MNDNDRDFRTTVFATRRRNLGNPPQYDAVSIGQVGDARTARRR
jgi:hypothetical protein